MPTSESDHASHAEFSKIYVFGDSLSDTGNLLNITGYPPAPYVNGRASNGSIWVDVLAQDLGLTLVPYTAIAASATPSQGVNFAFSGAMTGTENTNSGTPISSGNLPGLRQQIDNFTSLVAEQPADPNALYIIWAGTNDYLHGITNPTEPVANLTEAVNALVNLGAHTILMVNLPDLGFLPATRNTSKSSTLSHLTSLHNARLAEIISDLNQHLGSEFNLLLLDINMLFQQALAGRLGFTNVSDGCLNVSTGAICENPSNYLFWDDVHPTMTAHQQIEIAALNRLQPNVSGFSIPVGLGTLLVGLLGMGSMVRYKSQSGGE